MNSEAAQRLLTSPPIQLPRRICIAPMMDWTDRHCRYFHRILSSAIWLYTEMVTTGAVLHGNVARHLDFHSNEHPIALQLGGNDPLALAKAARLGEKWGYNEINLNCGCPSTKVQQGAFGAALMAQPQHVATCVRAMRNACAIPITVKHRIGLDEIQGYDFVRDFVGTVAEAGCKTFIVHARNAILSGLSPKENRDIPPLKYHYAYQLKQDFSELEIILNGGITDSAAIVTHWQHVDGVMLGRYAYHHPYFLSQANNLIYNQQNPLIDLQEVEEKFCAYICAQIQLGVPVGHMTRHILGLYHGHPGARAWRRILSSHQCLATATDAASVIALFKTARQYLGNPDLPYDA